MTARQPFGERSIAGQRKLPAALLTSSSGGPSSAATRSTQACTASGSRTSVGTASARRAERLAARDGLLERLAPPAADGDGGAVCRERPANARPMPLPPPVISATFPRDLAHAAPPRVVERTR